MKKKPQVIISLPLGRMEEEEEGRRDERDGFIFGRSKSIYVLPKNPENYYLLNFLLSGKLVHYLICGKKGVINFHFTAKNFMARFPSAARLLSFYPVA